MKCPVGFWPTESAGTERVCEPGRSRLLPSGNWSMASDVKPPWGFFNRFWRTLPSVRSLRDRRWALEWNAVGVREHSSNAGLHSPSSASLVRLIPAAAAGGFDGQDVAGLNGCLCG
jgi:hypothetical protein